MSPCKRFRLILGNATKHTVILWEEDSEDRFAAVATVLEISTQLQYSLSLSLSLSLSGKHPYSPSLFVQMEIFRAALL